MNSIKPILILVCLLMSTSLLEAQIVDFINDNYELAFQKAKEEGKMVFVDTYAAWCKPCKKQEPAFRDKNVALYFNDHFINLRVNMESRLGKIFATKHSVVFLPTLLILDANENVKYRSDQSFKVKILSADELLAIADAIVYPSTVRTAPSPRPSSTVANNTPALSETKKYRHVQHTPIKKENQEIVQQAATEKEELVTLGEEKILHVLGAGEDLPPEILKEEAYFRLSLMDGSHKETATKYLRAQKDWGTEENMRFLLDFIYTTRSDEFTYLIVNRHKFNELFGKEKVDLTINILVNQTLERGFPQPDLQESQALYSYLDPSNSRKKAHKYFLDRLSKEQNAQEYIPVALEYLNTISPEDHEVMYALASLRSSLDTKNESLYDDIGLVEGAMRLGGENYSNVLLLAKLKMEARQKEESFKLAQKAIVLAKAGNIKLNEINKLIREIESL